MPPVTSVLALIAKRPKPPPGSGRWPIQTMASRSDWVSAASVPWIFSVGFTLMVPSKAPLSELPASLSLTPVRPPASAAAKSPSVSEASTGSPCQMKRPVAPKLVEIDGQASENCTSSSVSASLRLGSRTTTVPLWMRISEKAAVRCAFGFWLTASACIRPDQLERPSGPTSTMMVGWSSDTSAISTLPISSGKKRRRALSRSAVSAGLPVGPSTTSAKLTRPEGNSDTLTRPRRVGFSPVTARISLNTCLRTVSAEIRALAATNTPPPTATTASSKNPRRFRPVVAVKGKSGCFSVSNAEGLYHRCYPSQPWWASVTLSWPQFPASR